MRKLRPTLALIRRRPLAVAGLVGAAVLWAMGVTTGVQAGTLPLPPYQVLLGDASSGQLTVVGGNTMIPIPAPVPGGISSLTLSPDGQTVYVTFQSGYLARLQLLTDSYVGSPLALGSGTLPVAAVVTGDGQDVWVALAGAPAVVEVATTTMTVVDQPIPLSGATNLALAADAGTLFVDGGPGSNVISVVDTVSSQVSTYPAPGPGPLALSPDQGRLYVLSESPTSGEVLVLDPATGQPLVPAVVLNLPSPPQLMELAPDGQHLYLGGGSAQLTSLDTSTWAQVELGTALPPGLNVGRSALGLSPDGASASLDVAATAAVSTGFLTTVPLADPAAATLSVNATADPGALLVAASGAVPPVGPVASPQPTAPPECMSGPIDLFPGTAPTCPATCPSQTSAPAANVPGLATREPIVPAPSAGAPSFASAPPTTPLPAASPWGTPGKAPSAVTAEVECSETLYGADQAPAAARAAATAPAIPGGSGWPVLLLVPGIGLFLGLFGALVRRRLHFWGNG